VELFAGLEADCLAGDDADFGSGAGIAADAGFAGLDGEDAEAAELDAVAGDHALLHAIEDGVDGGFGLGAGETSTFDNSEDEILFNHAIDLLLFSWPASLLGPNLIQVTGASLLMVGTVDWVVNAGP
jgi:hypothetical protein